MSEKTTLTIELHVDEVRCSLCKGYLACSPIRVLPDASAICGLCTPANTEVPVYRVLPLEAVLSKTSFPCRYKDAGCTELILFDQVGDHEVKCAHRSFACPSLTACPWKGSTKLMYEHFTKEHADLIKDSAEFKVEVDQEAQGVFMVEKQGVTFIIVYLYNTNDKSLKYDVKYLFNQFEHNVSFKTQIINDFDPEYTFIQKSTSCLLFDDSFYGMQNASILDLNKFLPGLENPGCILLIINLTLEPSHHDDFKLGNKESIILVDSLRCTNCHECLIPPLYDLDGKIICSACARNNSNASNNLELLKLITEAIIPCRWRDCTFEGKANNIRLHELSCQFVIHNCLFLNCTEVFKLTEASDHYINEHKVEVRDDIVYKLSFSVKFGNKHILIIKNYTLLLLQYNLLQLPTTKDIRHTISLYSSNKPDTISGTVHFEHQHCKIKSRSFYLNTVQGLSIALKDLPHCFQAHDELSVTVTV